MASDVQKLAENLGKLRRNRNQMTPAQKIAYRNSLQNFAAKISADSREVAMEFFLEGYFVLSGDKIEMDSIISRMKDVIESDFGKGELKKMSRALWKTYSVEEFLKAGLRLKAELDFRAYAPYFTSKTQETPDGFRNEIIDKFVGAAATWDPDGGIWGAPEKHTAVVMYPPTMELAEDRYREEVTRYERIGI